ncbi:MAG: sensor histidine kinase [Crocinitomicaceae bacterium]|nr:sensor histidine kinase [Crocinitomicaceae bacterium]
MRFCLLLLLTLFFSASHNSFAGEKIDSLEQLLATNIPDTSRVLVYSELCWEYRIVDQKKALKSGHQAVNLARKSDFKRGLGNALNDLSIIYIDKGSLDTAVVLLEEAKTIRDELNDGPGLAAIHNKLGIIYEHLVKLEEAMVNHMAALEYYESVGNKRNMGFCLNNIGNVHFKLKNYEKANEIHNQALQIRLSIDDFYGVAGSHSNLANLKMNMGDTTQAIYHYKEAIKVYRKHEFDNDLAVTLNNLGTLYIGQGEINKAEEVITEAYEIRKRLNDGRGICSSSILLGEIATEKGQYNSALRYLHTGLNKSIESGFRNKEKGAYEKLAKLHLKLNNADSVYHYYSLFFSIEKSQYEENLNQQVLELQTVYETEKKDRENERLAREKAEEKQLRAEAELKVANRNNWIIVITGITFILILLGLFLYQRKMKIAQEEKNKAVLDEKQKGLEAVFDATEEERQRIAKDLHDGVGQQMSGLKLAWENLSIELKQKSIKESERLEELSGVLDETAQEVREISHQMMPKVLKEFGLVPAIDEMLTKSLKHTKLSHEFEHFNINDRFTDRIEISLYRIAQELINNVIKHSGASTVSVQLFMNKEQLILIVEDNGSGFEQDDTDGHGLLNIKSRLNTINGEVNYEASTQSGTIATIRVDLSQTA